MFKVATIRGFSLPQSMTGVIDRHALGARPQRGSRDLSLSHTAKKFIFSIEYAEKNFPFSVAPRASKAFALRVEGSPNVMLLVDLNITYLSHFIYGISRLHSK